MPLISSFISCLQKWKSVLSLTSKADLDVSLKYVTADRTISKIKGKQKKPYGELLATVKMARNLSAIHGNNLSNPFCKWYTFFTLLPFYLNGAVNMFLNMLLSSQTKLPVN